MGLVLLTPEVCWNASIKNFQANDSAINNIADIINHIDKPIKNFHNNCRQLKLLGSSVQLLFSIRLSFDKDQLLTRVSFNIFYRKI
jgi:uncharacterized protein YdcH (DUF465 family)